MLNRLGCKVTHAKPYHGQSKPIERLFATLCKQFSDLWPTYCGNKPENKPESLQAQLDKGNAPELADFVEKFQQWVESAYNASPHSGDSMNGRSPEQVFAASWNGASKRTTSPDMLELLLMPETRPLKVGKNGVVYRGIRYGQKCPQLFDKLGQEVYLRVNINDISHVMVYSTNDEFICIAPSNDRLPANAGVKELSEANRAMASHRKLLGEYYQRRTRMHFDLPTMMIAAAADRAEENRKNNPPPPPEGPGSIVPIHSRVATAEVMRELTNAVGNAELRKAAGAESMSFLEAVGDKFRPTEDEVRQSANHSPTDTFAQLMKAFSPKRPGDAE